MRKYIIGMLIILAGIYFVMAFHKNTPQYLTHTLSKGNITEKVTATGRINPISIVNIGTQVSGTISGIYVDYNSKVKKNQLLAQIDPAIFEATVAQAKASLDIAEAQIKEVENDIIYYKKHLSRIKKLNESAYSTDKELETAQRDYDNAVVKLALQQARFKQAKAILDSSEIDLKHTKIISPVDGIVVSKEVEVGQTVAASFQTPTLFYVAEDLTKMKIETSVTEADIARIKEEQKVEFDVDAYPNETFKGVVTQIRNQAINSSNVIVYEVIIEIDNQNMKLKPGMTANVNIITAEKKNVLFVPNKALRFYLKDETGEVKRYKDKGIWVLSHGIPVRRNIKTLAYDMENTEIEGNVEVGDKIIIEQKPTEKDKKEMRLRMHR